MNDIAQQKSQIRHEMRQMKRQFSPEELAEKSRAAVKKLLNLPEFQGAKTVMLYHSLPNEVATHELILQLLPEKNVVLPAVVRNEIEPRLLDDSAQLVGGKFAIQEPDTEVFSGKIDLIVVPGVAFATDGSRLGRGGGFYDRFLAQNPQIPTVGLCFDFQLLQNLPTEPHDLKVNCVVSD